METTGIDLTKCNNLRYRAKVAGKEVEGRIAVDGDYLRFFYSNGDIYSIHIPCYRKHGTDYFDDLEIVPRDPETYQDWQVGDRATDPNEKWNDSAYKEIIFRSGELVICKDGNGDISGGYTCGQLHRLGWRLVLTDIERQIIEEKKKYEPQDGDVCYAKSTSGFYAIFVYNRCGLDSKTDFYVSFDSRGGLFYSGYAIATSCLEELRPATEEEKQRLFDAMAKAGQRWNAEKKAVEDIPKPHEFRKGEPVLVRCGSENRWQLGAFCWIDEKDDTGFPYIVGNGLVGGGFKYCLPYNERTMHLLGTAEDYK